MRTLALLVTIITTVPLAASRTAEAQVEAWTGASSMLGGTSRYDGGEWVYQDFIFDDYGANTQAAGASQRVSLASTVGDFRYPTNARYAGNAADINEVRARLAGDDIEVRVLLNTLVDPSAAVVGVAITSEGNAGEARDWPLGAGVRSPWSTFVTVAGGRTIVHGHDGDPVEGAPPVVDAEANTIAFVVPGAGAGSSADLVTASGLWDGERGEWLAGQSGNSPSDGVYSTGGSTAVRVFDVAFNTNAVEPESGNWREDVQAARLAAGDLSTLSQTVDFARLESGASDAPILQPGFYDRIFVSRQELGEGVYGDFPQYKGRYQTYGLWIPEGYDASDPAPLVLVLHSLSVHHNQYAGSQVYRQLGNDLGAIAVTPLARGPNGWYWDEALVDTLEVWADVKAHYAIDDEKTSSTGYSMGGYGTYRLTTMMPDRFAAAVSWVGPPAHQIWAYPLDPLPSGPRQNPGNTYGQLENTQHVPFMIVHGTNDELVPVTGVTHQASRFDELGYTHRYALHPGLDHFAFAVLDDWTRERQWMSGRTRVIDPAHVVFKVRPASWATSGSGAAPAVLGHLDALGANLDSAYWVRDVAVAGEGDVTGVVDLVSEGRGTPIEGYAPGTGAAAGPPSPYIERSGLRSVLLGGVGDVLRGQLRGVTALTVDVDRAGLSLEAAVEVSTDVPATLRLVSSGGSREVALQPGE